MVFSVGLVLVLAFVALLLWSALEMMRAVDTNSDTALRRESIRLYHSSRPAKGDIAERMRNPTASDFYRDGAVRLRFLFDDTVPSAPVQDAVARSFARALKMLAKAAGRSSQPGARTVVDKIDQAARLYLGADAGAMLGPLLLAAERSIVAGGRYVPEEDPFNVGDELVVSHTGRAAKTLLLAFRFEELLRSPAGLADVVREAMVGSERWLGGEARVRAMWGLRTMLAHPAEFPMGAESSSDLEVFAAAWMWSKEPHYAKNRMLDRVQANLVRAVADVVVVATEGDKTMSWELGALCRVSHIVQALAGMDSVLDDESTSFLVAGATTKALLSSSSSSSSYSSS